jgi:secreted trypsin-like serine protease
MQVSIPIKNNNTCSGHFNIFDPLTQLCAGDIDDLKGVCNGDSGGPLIKNVNGQWTLIGIVSYGRIGCSGYGGFTRVNAFYDWILKNGI